MKKIFYCCLLFNLCCVFCRAQGTTDSTAMLKMLVDMSKAYKSAGMLGYDVTYLYTTENEPFKSFDSLQGRIEMDSAHYWCRLDNTESMSNDKYAVVLFKEDKLMYLSKASLFNRSNDPLQMLQRLSAVAGKASYEQTITGHYKTITIRFEQLAVCKQIEYTVDTKTGYLSRMVYVIPTEQLVDESARQSFDGAKEGYGKYARVEAVFSNYSKLPSVDSKFDEKFFFTKQGNEFVPASSFNDYKIFVASLNL